MNRFRLTCSALFLSVAALAIACSSGSDGSGTNGDDDDDTGASSGADDCSCNVTHNGVSKKLACSESGCVDGVAFECSASAGVSQSGDGCETSSSSSSGGGGSSSSSGGSSSSSGGSAATTVSCPYSGDGLDADENDVCDATTEYCIVAINGGAICAPFPAGCSACGCASDNADAAWKAANNGTANCGQAVNMPPATISCASANGAVTVTCD